MLVGLLLRHYKTYENAHFIPLSDSIDHKLNIFIGNNGVGKSSVLEALDSFFNGKYWNVNKNGAKKDSYISPVFLINKKEVKKNSQYFEVLSEYFWSVTADESSFTSKKQLTAGFFPLRDKLLERYSKEEYYFLTVGISYERQADIYIPFFYNHFGEKLTQKELILIKNEILYLYNYVYIPIESSIKNVLAIEATEAQALMGRVITDEIDKILTEKVFTSGSGHRVNKSVLDVINSRLDEFMVNINQRMQYLGENYSYNKEGKVKKNLTASDIRDIVIKEYFSIRTLKKENKEINDLSSGEKRIALIDLAYTFLSVDENKDSNIILAIDEPEASMHASLCFDQFKRLSELSNTYNRQVIATTHWYGLLPMCQKGTLHHINNINSSPTIKSFLLSNILEQRRTFPDDVELKSIFDLVSSILSIMKKSESNWLICEGSDDAMYLKYLIGDKVNNLTILPVGGCANVIKIYSYLFTPISEKIEKGLINGRVFCLIDTDDQQPSLTLPSESGKELLIRRLQRHENNVSLSRVGKIGVYSKTEIEDCLGNDCFYDAVSHVIEELAPNNIKEIYSNFKFSNESLYSNINYDDSCIKPINMEGHENKKDLINYIQKPEIKFEIAKKYIENDEHDLEWINEILNAFNK